VMTTLAWWRSRSSRLTAVVCSGRNRPQDSKGQWLALCGNCARGWCRCTRRWPRCRTASRLWSRLSLSRSRVHSRGLPGFDLAQVSVHLASGGFVREGGGGRP